MTKIIAGLIAFVVFIFLIKKLSRKQSKSEIDKCIANKLEQVAKMEREVGQLKATIANGKAYNKGRTGVKANYSSAEHRLQTLKGQIASQKAEISALRAKRNDATND